MLELIAYLKSVLCALCDKSQECVTVRCPSGTFDGNLCAKCLMRLVRARAGKPTGPPAVPPQPQP